MTDQRGQQAVPTTPPPVVATSTVPMAPPPSVFHLPLVPRFVPKTQFEALMTWADDAMEELADIRGQWGDDYIYKKHNERSYQELLNRLERLKQGFA